MINDRSVSDAMRYSGCSETVAWLDNSRGFVVYRCVNLNWCLGTEQFRHPKIEDEWASSLTHVRLWSKGQGNDHQKSLGFVLATHLDRGTS